MESTTSPDVKGISSATAAMKRDTHHCGNSAPKATPQTRYQGHRWLIAPNMMAAISATVALVRFSVLASRAVAASQ